MSAIKSNEYGTYNVCYGRSYSIKRLIDIIEKITEKNIKIKRNKPIKGEVEHSILDNSKIKKKLRFQIRYSLENGLKETWNWYKKNFKEI